MKRKFLFFVNLCLCAFAIRAQEVQVDSATFIRYRDRAFIKNYYTPTVHELQMPLELAADTVICFPNQAPIDLFHFCVREGEWYLRWESLAHEEIFMRFTAQKQGELNSLPLRFNWKRLKYFTPSGYKVIIKSKNQEK